ncbi:MAG: hypothetical protein H6868_02325 [Rhodospirillales bacterium]|nr:hypothetical protein [Rhodospirillales bacterium]
MEQNPEIKYTFLDAGRGKNADCVAFLQECHDLTNGVWKALNSQPIKFSAAIEAFRLSIEHHHYTIDSDEGFQLQRRRDGWPAFLHQVCQAAFTLDLLNRNLPVLEPDALLSTNFCHDLIEDTAITKKTIQERINRKTAHRARLMAKKENGVKLYSDENICDYYDLIENDPVTSLAKGLDRMQNMSTMIGGMKPDKMIAYINETETYILPMLKRAAKLFPEQKETYEALGQTIEAQICRTNQFLYQTGYKKQPVPPWRWVDAPNDLFDTLDENFHPVKLIEKRAAETMGLPLKSPTFSASLRHIF